MLLWQVEAPFWAWAGVSALLGIGFTFFSGAVEAWLVDALDATGFDAAIVAGADILGGIAAPRIRRLFERRTSALLATAALSTVTLAAIGVLESFWAVLALIVAWGLLWAAGQPPEPRGVVVAAPAPA